MGTVVADWNWAHGTHHLICSPPEDGEYASYVLDTALLVVAVKGGAASFSLPRAGGPPTFSPQGALAALQGLPVQWVAVKLNTASLAGGAAALRHGGLNILLAADSGGGSGGDGPPNDPQPGLQPSQAGTYQSIQNRIKSEGKLLRASPASVPNPNAQPTIQQTDGSRSFSVEANQTYLWIIDADANLIIAKEHTAQGVIKHTQMTNFAKAYGGGEVVFNSSGQVTFLEANSGRYMGYNRLQRQQTRQIEQWAGELFNSIGHPRK